MTSDAQWMPKWLAAKPRAARSTREGRAWRALGWAASVYFVVFTLLSVKNVVAHPDQVETWSVTWLALIMPLAFANFWYHDRRGRGDALRRGLFMAGSLFVGLFAFVFLWVVYETAPFGLVGVSAFVVGTFLAMAIPVRWHRWTGFLGVAVILVVSTAMSPYSIVAAPLAFLTLWLLDAATGFYGMTKASQAIHEGFALQQAKRTAARKGKK